MHESLNGNSRSLIYVRNKTNLHIEFGKIRFKIFFAVLSSSFWLCFICPKFIQYGRLLFFDCG